MVRYVRLIDHQLIMELKIIQKPELVVALDIGSTHSGYAWQWRRDFENNRSNVEFNTNWGSGALQLHKTSTCLLLDKDKNVHSFGHAAEQKFCRLLDGTKGSITGEWYLFKRFKLILQKDRVRKDVLVDDYVGQHMPLIEVMTKFIGALKGHFLKMSRDKNQTVNMETTLWVVTVPAIWSDESRNFMRSAAEKSGIEKKNLMIALEPEAAAVYCMHLPNELRKAMNTFGTTGDTFLTVDLGGGTADISATKVTESGRLEELCRGTGSLVGGEDINNAFFETCKNSFVGNEWRNTFRNQNAEELLEMENDFEKKKVSFERTEEEDEYINLYIPYTMKKMLEKNTLQVKNVPEVGDQFKVDEGKFMFKSAYIREKLFKVTVNRILKAMAETFDKTEVKQCKTVVLVGGFAESSIVVDDIRNKLESKYPRAKVVVPTSPFRAVLNGAVLFGHDPLIFTSRISRATYGVETNSKFDPDNHDEDKRWKLTETGIDYCKDIFSIHVKKDQSVALNAKQPSHNYFPAYKDQTEVLFNIFLSPEWDPKYTTDEGCKQLGTVTVKMPDTTGGRSRGINVTMIYGGTELSVRAVDETTGKEFSADIDFGTI